MSRGARIAEWIERFLVHAEGDWYGQPFHLHPFQRAFLEDLYREDVNGRRIVRRALLGLPKGNGKSELAAAIAVAELAGPYAPESPNVIIAAASFEQADITFGAARTMITQGPLAPFHEAFDTEVLRRDGPGSMRRIAAAAGTNDGGRPTCFVADELHEWTAGKERVHLVVSNGLSKRRDGLEVSITTPGNDRDTLLGRLYAYGRQVESHEVSDPAFLFSWAAAGEGWDLADPEQLRAAILEANPAIAAGFLDAERLAARFHEIPEHEFRRYHLGQWVSSPEHWIAPEHWSLCARPGDPPPDGTRIVLGFDGSVRRDCTALVGCTIGTTNHLFTVATWEPHGEPVPRLEVDAAIAAAMRRWDVVELACDPNGWREDLERWAAEYGDRVNWYEMSPARTAPACDALRGAVQAAVEGMTPLPMTHDAGAVLARHVANARTSPTRWGEHIKKDHKDSPNRIDAAMAAVIAYDRARWLASQPAPAAVATGRVTFIDWDDDD